MCSSIMLFVRETCPPNLKESVVEVWGFLRITGEIVFGSDDISANAVWNPVSTEG